VINNLCRQKVKPEEQKDTADVGQYSEPNVMHLLFSLLRIKGLCKFRALVAHPQEAHHKRHLYIAYMLCQLAAPSSFCVAPPEEEQVMLETCRGP
jgi:hypothetical protein